ncbi:copper resistance CopC/CopD family protein [Nocardioides antri]|uniref:Copper resistance protein CopC n=1 Tax=Nocardioides antri TaxID=2607659 RepID=A0A5B1M733_9ACTN|nr:copper resistance protein CopC [Nocardioides antri]KAA1428671.1 copper resistance protein CopC [Nocardioides antri]
MTSGDNGPSWQWVARLIAGVVAALASVVMFAGPASAHAALVDTSPDDGAVLAEAPDDVRLTFNGPVRLLADGIRLYDAAGEDFPVAAEGEGSEIVVETPAELGEGSFVVSWRVVSADGHPLSGSFTFSIGSRSDTVAPAPASADPSADAQRLHSVTQGGQYVALLLAAGLVVFLGLLPRSAPAAVRRRVAKVGLVMSVLASVASLLLVPLSAAIERGAGVAAIFSTTALSDPGPVAAEWLVAFLVTGGLFLAMAASRGGGGARPGRRWYGVALIGVTAALTGPALVGHTRSFGPEMLLVLTDVAHLAAGAVWLGGLVGLVIALPRLAGHGHLGAQVLSRFSTAAAASLLVLTVMGSVLSWRILASWDLLFHTSYGILLLTKIAIVVVAILVAAANRFVLLPRVQDPERRDETGAGTHPIRRAIAVEGVLLVGALLVTGFLTNQAPHPSPDLVSAPAASSHAQSIGDLRIVTTLDSGTVGPNTVRIETEDTSGAPRTLPHRPVVSLSSDSHDLGSLPITRTGPATYEASAILPSTGTWEIQVSLRLSRFENPVFTVPVTVS